VAKALKNADLIAFQAFFIRQTGFSESALDMLIKHTNEVAVLQILARFKNTVTEAVSTVRTGLLNDDKEEVWKICHKVAGVADLLGFERLGKMSREFSHELQYSANPNLDNLQKERVGRYLEECETLLVAINESCPNLAHYL
jgi:HPt (histidine-containing phosphotransfer) domain-containing protein